MSDLLTWEEIQEWVKEFNDVPDAYLNLATSSAGKPGKMKVFRSLLSIAEAYRKDALRMRRIDEAVANDSLASDGMEMIQSAMRE